MVRQAVADAGLGEDLSKVPVLVGTTMREQRGIELRWRDDADAALEDLHFGTALKAAFGAPTTYIFANACSATLYALGMATDMIGLGQADTVVVAGTDAATESGFGTLDRMQNDIPDALRPFDATHKGMLMGEGAAAVVVQRAGTGNGPVRAWVGGVGTNCDARHATAPDLDGITRAVQDAYRRAGARAQDIDPVILHGSGTPSTMRPAGRARGRRRPRRQAAAAPPRRTGTGPAGNRARPSCHGRSLDGTRDNPGACLME
ncbi:beta-ketoacyl synthase N-terminal-like domain-containing protein [Streptomyces sp. BBFR102]|uniref:beta-ketoacyl synthase N-terminal-like domain-containing protein n=1 Tax=Streptomyces sp. BBFR102 TaxID=3448171 RepID=UPI003F53127D